MASAMLMRSRTSSGARCAAGGRRQTKLQVRCSATRPEQQSRRELLGVASFVALTAFAPFAKAGLIEDLKAASEEKKEVNNRARLSTSYANLARSRTVADGTCNFPKNFFGCEAAADLEGGVKYLSEDHASECDGRFPGKCNSRVNMNRYAYEANYVPPPTPPPEKTK